MVQDKEAILEHYYNSIDFVQLLHLLTECQWRSKIEGGRWSIAEIVGHLPPWDEFVLSRLTGTKTPTSTQQ
ncbi:MAG: DinB family protein [Bacillus sp. (in: firmicutes)]